MDLVSIVQIALRRWYITVPLAILTAVAAYLVQTTVDPEFEARGTVILANPTIDPSRTPDAAINVRAIADELNSPESREALRAEGATAGFEIRRAEDAIIDVVAVADTEEAAQRTAEIVVMRLAQEIERVQVGAEVPANEMVRSRVITENISAQEQGTPVLDGEGESSFRAVGSLVLEDPLAGFENPLPASAATGRVLQLAVQSDTGQERFEARSGGELEFEIVHDPRDAAPLIEIVTRGSDEGAVLEAFHHVREMLAAELEHRQDEAEIVETRRTRIDVVAEPLVAENVSPPLDRAVAAVAALGGMMTLGLLLLVEGITSRRRQRVEAPVVAAVPDEPVPPWLTPWPYDRPPSAATRGPAAGNEHRAALNNIQAVVPSHDRTPAQEMDTDDQTVPDDGAPAAADDGDEPADDGAIDGATDSEHAERREDAEPLEDAQPLEEREFLEDEASRPDAEPLEETGTVDRDSTTEATVDADSTTEATSSDQRA